MRLPVGFIIILISIILLNACSEVDTDTPVVIQVYAAKKDNVNKTELFAILSDGSEVKLSGDLTVGGNVIDVAISPDGLRVAYIADQEVAGFFELFVATFGASGVIKLSGTSATGGNLNIEVGNQKTAINWAPDSSRIAYVASQDTAGLNELFVSTVDGLSNLKISGAQIGGTFNGVGITDDIYWSPNSLFVAYRAEEDNLNFNEIYISSADGITNRKVSGDMLTSGGNGGAAPGQIFWSPDSRFVAYLARQESPNILELFISTPDGLTNTKINGSMVASNGNVQTSPAPFWSPDSSQITYMGDQNLNGEFELFAGTTDGLSNPQLSDPLVGTTVNTESLLYSPDGSAVLYLAPQDNAFDELFVSSADGAANIRASANVLVGAGGDRIMQAAWSPDGLKIAYAATLDASGPKLFIVSPDGTANTILTANVPAGFNTIDSIEWSPDGSKVSYVYSDNNLATDGQLNIADVASSTSSVVTNTLTLPQLGSRDVSTIKWSADSQRLTFMAHDDSGDNELYVIQSGIIDKLSGDLVVNGSVSAFF